MELIHKRLSYDVVGAAMEVHRHLGPGFLEAVYEHALAQELGFRRIPFERQISLLVTYKDVAIGEYRPDFLIDDRLIVEVKAISGLTSAHEAQALLYLASTGLRLAILINFGTQRLQTKRVVR